MAQVKINWKAFVCDLNQGSVNEETWIGLEQFVRAVVVREFGVNTYSELADECVQEIALKLHESKKAKLFEEAKTPASYMYSSVRNTAADLIRAGKAERRSIQEYAERLVQTQCPEPTRIAVQNENADELLRAIRLLGKLDQDLIRGFHLGMDTIGELAERHNISPTNITTRLERAKKRIKRYLINP